MTADQDEGIACLTPDRARAAWARIPHWRNAGGADPIAEAADRRAQPFGILTAIDNI